MLHLHSILRWAVLILLVVAIVQSYKGWKNKSAFTEGNAKIGLFLMIAAHVQLLLGLYLYMVNGWLGMPMAEAMGEAASRFWKVEHIGVMIIAIALITIGRIRTKKLAEDVRKHKTAVIFYGISLLLILSRIPWSPASRLY